MRFALALCLSALSQSAAPVENVSTFPPRPAIEERKALHVPEGFEVQLVAAEPDIQKPMNLAFDDRGRLWVTGSYEYPFPAPEGKTPRDTVKILEDFGPDGRARKITTFASGLNIPIGIVPLPGAKGALVYSIPSIDRFLDDDGDGRADRREPIYRKYGSRDTHGMTGSFSWGFDGWIYACHGFANDSTVTGSDNQSIQMNSGNVYRMKPDGSHAEYFSHGQVNPFGLAFDPLGNLYSSDCHSRPLYQLLRGAYYPSFGKPDDGLGFGPEMMTHDHGSTAIDGATYYAADQYPEAYRGTLYVGNVMTNRINHDRLEFRGSTPRAIKQPDFVWSEDNWFRPVDIELGPDGALYVADFYNRIIGHYEVPLTHPGRDHDHGRIWRIVYRGPAGEDRPVAPPGDLAGRETGALVEAIGDANLAVRTRAANQLALRQDPGLDDRLAALVAASGPVWQRVHALWVLARRDRLDSSLLEKAAGDPAREVRLHAFRVLADRAEAGESLLRRAREALRDDEPMVRRTAAEALGLHPSFANIRPLLDLRQASAAEDTHLVHAVRMALRNQLREAPAWNELARAEWSDRDVRDVADVATGVHSAEAASYLLRHLNRHDEPNDATARYLHHVARYGDDASRRSLAGYLRDHLKQDPKQLARLFKEVRTATQERGGVLDTDVRAMSLDLARAWLDSGKTDEVLRGIDLAKTFELGETRGKLESFARDPEASAPKRQEAMTALMEIGPSEAYATLGRVLADSTAPDSVRERAAALLGALDRNEARALLLAALPPAPERVQAAIAFGLAAHRRGAEALLTAIGEGKASARLLQEPRVALPMANHRIEDLAERTKTLLKGLPPADTKLRDLLKQRRQAFAAARPDADRGSKVFEKNCAICHQIGGKGQRIGPQLDGIGARGVDRLLEDILDPNRNVDQAFRTTTLAQKNGQVASGLLLKEEGEVLVLADSQGKEVRVPRDDVEERSTTQLSPMPANLADQIAPPDFADLVAFLLREQQKPGNPQATDNPVKEGSR